MVNWRSPYERCCCLVTPLESKTTNLPLVESSEKKWTPVFTIWMFPKIVGFPAKSSILIRAVFFKPSILGGNTPIFGNTHITVHWQVHKPLEETAGAVKPGKSQGQYLRPGPHLGWLLVMSYVLGRTLGRPPFFSPVGYSEFHQYF